MTEETVLLLGDGILAKEAQPEGSQSFLYDPDDPAHQLINTSDNELQIPADYSGEEKRADHLTFTTVSSSQALIHDLPVGHYVLTETIAPRGYLIAESISFEVRNDGTIWVAGTPADQMVDRIVMQDLADPTYGTTQDDTSVLGVRRDAPAEETSATTTTTPTEASSGSVTRTGETAVSATAIVAVVLLIAGGSVLILRRKFEA